MYNSGGLIPARYLILIAHLIVTITLLWNSKESVKSCLGENYTKNVFSHQHMQLIVGLSVSLGMIGFELLVFLAGITMFHPTSALLSVSCHASGTAALCYLIFNKWQCGWFWWIFSVSSVLPILYDTTVVFNTCWNRKYSSHC